MSKASFEIPVSPAVIRWARQTAGWDVHDIAKRVRIPPAAYTEWESKETAIKLSQLQELARCFKRPLSAFLLNEPPKEPGPPADFRLLPGRIKHFDKKTRLAIRKANRLQMIASELMNNVGQDPTPILSTAKTSDNPEEVAQHERKRLEVDLQTQFDWRFPWDAYRAWRNAVEEKNVLLFQFPMPVADARGFSLSNEQPFAVVVSSSDAVNARIFTLFHEYAHLLLRNPGICLPSSEPSANRPEGLVERWCNRFAGALLIPRDALQDLVGNKRLDRSRESLTEVLASISKMFKVSEEAALVRIFELGLLSRAAFRRELDELHQSGSGRRRGGGRSSMAGRCLSENGRLFTSLVLQAKGRNVITYADVSDYLSLKLKYLPEVQTSLLAVA